jgi:hypothetical protein
MAKSLLACAFAALAIVASAAAAGGTDRMVALTTGCTAFGPTWVHSYNHDAIQAGNPIRLLAACCHSTGMVGIHHCYVAVTLAGTPYRGCESVDIGRNGLPASVGRHERCVDAAAQSVA